MSTDPIKQDELPEELSDLFYLYRVAKTNGVRRDVEQRIVNYFTSRSIPKQALAAALDRIEQSCNQHTTPDGTHLVTRSYVKNTLDFERQRFGLEPKGDNSGKGSDQDG